MTYLDNPQVFLFDRKLVDRYIKRIVINVLQDLNIINEYIDVRLKPLLNDIVDTYIVEDFAGLNEHRRDHLFGACKLSEESRLKVIRLLLKLKLNIEVLVYNENYDIEYPLYEYVIDLIEERLYGLDHDQNVIKRYLLGISKNEYNEYKVELDSDVIVVTDSGDYRINRFYEEKIK